MSRLYEVRFHSDDPEEKNSVTLELAVSRTHEFVHTWIMQIIKAHEVVETPDREEVASRPPLDSLLQELESPPDKKMEDDFDPRSGESIPVIYGITRDQFLEFWSIVQDPRSAGDRYLHKCTREERVTFCQVAKLLNFPIGSLLPVQACLTKEFNNNKLVESLAILRSELVMPFLMPMNTYGKWLRNVAAPELQSRGCSSQPFVVRIPIPGSIYQQACTQAPSPLLTATCEELDYMISQKTLFEGVGGSKTEVARTEMPAKRIVGFGSTVTPSGGIFGLVGSIRQKLKSRPTNDEDDNEPDLPVELEVDPVQRLPKLPEKKRPLDEATLRRHQFILNTIKKVHKRWGEIMSPISLMGEPGYCDSAFVKDMLLHYFPGATATIEIQSSKFPKLTGVLGEQAFLLPFPHVVMYDKPGCLPCTFAVICLSFEPLY